MLTLLRRRKDLGNAQRNRSMLLALLDKRNARGLVTQIYNAEYWRRRGRGEGACQSYTVINCQARNGAHRDGIAEATYSAHSGLAGRTRALLAQPKPTYACTAYKISLQLPLRWHAKVVGGTHASPRQCCAKSAIPRKLMDVLPRLARQRPLLFRPTLRIGPILNRTPR
jgi:hypothetical protein